MDWAAAAYRARRQIGARARTFPQDRSLALIDAMAAHGTMTPARMQQHGTADVVATVLGHVTTAIHGRGHVPAVNGWYRRDGADTIIHPGFAIAWAAARACEAPPAAGAGR
ncbi:hypothetical protein [Methylobacterium frigidaeris]|uniref:Uncharacterized protein n=1 Tax=Methylobacterium frigidaeris TaxID=2038277 RepID=A0AA37HG38_9HYPH|nr:hypothetical protein [Methylobacterium frigidaeris]PIK73988.1 hypothetical protein CS379_05110 [Methylobacterium frigidaeris]GJD64575.1 hypothetical protein MPEAHAMD_4758 [Methylobacterium frigidaeris]